MGDGKKTSQAMRQIDENLKRVYQDIEDDQIPDRFVELLNRLKEQDRTDDN